VTWRHISLVTRVHRHLWPQLCKVCLQMLADMSTGMLGTVERGWLPGFLNMKCFYNLCVERDLASIITSSETNFGQKQVINLHFIFSLDQYLEVECLKRSTNRWKINSFHRWVGERMLRTSDVSSEFPNSEILWSSSCRRVVEQLSQNRYVVIISVKR
jgi:Acetylglutamate synthase